MAPTRHRRVSSGRAAYDPTTSADDPSARPTVRLLDLLLQVSLDAGHTSLQFRTEAPDAGLVVANADGETRVLLRTTAEAVQSFVERLKGLAEWPGGEAPVGYIHIKQGSPPLALRLTLSGSGTEAESAMLELGWEDEPGTPA